MKKINFILISVVFLLFLNMVLINAHGEEIFAQAEEIIKQKIPCNELSEEQLEILGDYYMEQMHPGEAHEYMDEMMGGEGSESLKQIHINMGKAFYCGEHDTMSGEMMPMMTGGNMMGSGGMMGMMNTYNTPGMMTGTLYPNQNRNFNWLFSAVLVLIIILLAILIIKQMQKPKRKRHSR